MKSRLAFQTAMQAIMAKLTAQIALMSFSSTCQPSMSLAKAVALAQRSNKPASEPNRTGNQGLEAANEIWTSCVLSPHSAIKIVMNTVAMLAKARDGITDLAEPPGSHWPPPLAVSVSSCGLAAAISGVSS